MNWLLLTIIAYFILALVGIADKLILNKVVTDDRLYTWLVGVLGLLAFVIAPWGLTWPGWFGFLLDLIAGLASIGALMFLYRALKQGEASLVIPLIGGGVPILTAVFSIFFLGESFSARGLLALISLLLGGVLITLIPKSARHWWQFWRRRESTGNQFAFLAVIFFSTFFILSKHLYNTQGFFNGFVWARLGAVIIPLWMLREKKFRTTVKLFFLQITKGKKYLFLINQFFGGLGFILLNYAIALSSVAIISALQGVEYIFILLIASLLSLWRPDLIQERLNKKIILEKSAAIIFIALGLYLITVNQL